MFSDALEQRVLLLREIGSSFDGLMEVASDLVVESVENGGTLFFAGNGGSAAEAQHMSAEYLATLDHRNFRRGIPSIALSTDTSFLTAWTNDFGYKEVFARQLETMARKGDIFFAYSTSGNSENIIEGIVAAKNAEVKVVGFTGNSGGAMVHLCDVCFVVPSNSTAQIQEVHTMLGHELCGNVEKRVFSN